MKQTCHSQTGISTLLVILIIALLLELAFFSVFLLGRIGTQRSLSTQYSQKAYYAAEGVLYDTFQILRSNPSWPLINPYVDVVQVGDTAVERTVTYDPVTKTYQIDIGSNFNEAKRRFTAEYSRESTPSTQALDIILIVDHSNSMVEEMDESVNPTSILEEAVFAFIDGLVLQGNDRMGIVSFGDAATLDQSLIAFTPSNRTVLKDVVESMVPSGATFMTQALEVTQTELQQPNPPGPPRKKIVVLFTDGVSNIYLNGGIPTLCLEKLCSATEPVCPTFYAPLDRGTVCSDNTVTIGENMRTVLSYDMYGIFYDPNIILNPDYSEFGKAIIDAVIDDPNKVYEANTAADLIDAFEAISQSVSDIKESFQFQEVEPLPN